MDFFDFVEENSDSILGKKKQVFCIGKYYVISNGTKQRVVSMDEYEILYKEYKKREGK